MLNAIQVTIAMLSRVAVPLVKQVSMRMMGASRMAAVRAFSAQTFLDRGEVSERVLNVLKNFEKTDAAKITETAKFIEDLGLDSLDVVEVVMAVEEEFVIEIPDNEAERLLTPAQVIDYVAAHPMAK
ncbi:acyl carrier protein [Aphanomyces cochlioides]|nr:acyl carrier protein [Aphanomyces cochlioides]